MAGRDIRRLVAQAHMTSGPEKVLTLRRLMAGIRAADATALIADDPEGLARQVARDQAGVELLTVPGPGSGDPAQTGQWARALQAAGARVLISVGGDGTQRQVARVSLTIPVLPVAGGTNNVSCWTGDQTAAGMAAGLVAAGAPPAGVTAKLVHVATAEGEEVALVDVAHVRQPYLGALAVWDPGDVEALLLTVADPARPGLSSPGGSLWPVAPKDDAALVINLGAGGSEVPAVVAPGLVVRFPVRGFRPIRLGEPVTWEARSASTLALDGERTVMLKAGEAVTLTVRRDGPFMLDPSRILRPVGKEIPDER